MKRIKLLGRLRGVPNNARLQLTLKINEAEASLIREIAIQNYQKTKNRGAATGLVVVDLIRSALYCFRHHTTEYTSPQEWTQEEASRAGLRVSKRRASRAQA